MSVLESRGPWTRQPDGSWADADGCRVGNQRPRIFFGVSPDVGPTSAVEDVRALADDFGLSMYEWQDWFAGEALRERRDALWAAMTVCLILPRQNGKTLLIILRILAGLFLWGEKLIVYSAHQFVTTLETFNAVVSVLDRSRPDDPNYSELIANWIRAVGGYRVVNSHGHESIIFGNGARVKFVARINGKGRGFTGDTVIFDEAGFKIDPSITDALIPSMSAVRNPQLWFLSSSGTLDSNVLLELRAKILAGREDSFCYAEWSIPQKFDDADAPEPDIDDKELWYYANPLLGIRITERYIEKVERNNLTRSGFLRERLGVWGEPESTDRPISLAAWAACENTDSDVPRTIVGMDVAMDRDSASLVSVGAVGPDLVVHLEATGAVADVERAAVRMSAESDDDMFTVVVPSYGPAAASGTRLRAAGCPVTDMPSGKASVACSSFADLVRTGGLVHLGQEPLDAAVRSASKQMSGANWTFDRRRPSDDISPLWAAAVGVWHMETLDADDPGEISGDDVGVGT